MHHLILFEFSLISFVKTYKDYKAQIFYYFTNENYKDLKMNCKKTLKVESHFLLGTLDGWHLV